MKAKLNDKKEKFISMNNSYL